MLWPMMAGVIPVRPETVARGVAKLEMVAELPDKAGPYKVPTVMLWAPIEMIAGLPPSGDTPAVFRTVTVEESTHEWTLNVPLLPSLKKLLRDRAVGSCPPTSTPAIPTADP